MLIVDQDATALLAATVKADPEAKIRALWTAQGVPEEMQNALVAGIAAKAQPGAQVGPFTIPVNKRALAMGIPVFVYAKISWCGLYRQSTTNS